MNNQHDQLKKLREPFPQHQISILCRSTKKDNAKGKCAKCGGWHGLPAIQLSYVGHAALTDRLLEVDPTWTWEPMAVGKDGYPVIDGNGGMWIKLTVCGVTRLGYGDAQGKVGGDAMKERIGDALRNAAMRFGAALELWHKGDLHIDEPPADEQPERVSAKPVAKDVFDNMNGDDQETLRNIAMEAKVFIGRGKASDAVDYIKEQQLDADMNAALWSLFDSKERSAIKKAAEAMKAQPEPAKEAA